MTFGIVIRILVLCCLVGPNLTMTTMDDVELTCGGFTVRRVKILDTKPPQRLQFQDVLTNGGGWSNVRNEFKAPCKGAYFFTFDALSTENGKFDLALVKGRHTQVTAYGDDNGYQTGSNSALLILKAEDIVHLEIKEGSFYVPGNDEFYTTFSGHLVEKLE